MASTKEEMRMMELSSRLDRFLAEFSTANINRKANEVGRELIKFLATNPDAINTYGDVAQFIESLGTHWVANQNSKVSQYGLEALILIAESMQSKYKNFSGAVFQHAITKLGDSKESLREKARAYLVKAVQVGAHNPNYLLEKLCPLLNNKNKDMSTEAQKTVLEILTMYKSRKLNSNVLNELVKTEISCLGNHLREDAAVIILDLAERVSKARIIEQLQEEYKSSGGHQQKKILALVEELKTNQAEHGGTPAVEDVDEPEFAVPKLKRAPTAKSKSAASAAMATRSSLARGSSVRASKIGEGDKYALHSGPAGEADEAWFLSAFEDVPVITCVNHREFDNLTRKITEDLKSGAEFWERKVDALKKLRSMILNLTGFDEEIQGCVKNLALELMHNLKDLRSQVVRETCLTIAYICQQLKNKVEAHTCEVVMQQLMSNVMSSAKVIATASYIALKFMFLHVHHSRMINTLVQTLLNSKSREVRTAACEFLLLILTVWPVQRLEQQIPALQEGIKKGTAESSTEGRMAARKAFWAFRSHFPEQGEALLNSLDTICRKNVMAGEPEGAVQVAKAKATLPRSTIGRQTSVGIGESSGSRQYSSISSVRSTSAIDLQAVQRAKARQQYAALARQKVGSGASLPRPKKVEPPTPSGPASGTFVGERTGRTRSKIAGVSQSQPTSRSGSPSSRLGYHTFTIPDSSTLAFQTQRNFQRSQENSRETSPSRVGSKPTPKKLLATRRTRMGGIGERPPIQLTRPVQAQKMLAKSVEAENIPLSPELYDGDTGDMAGYKVSPRKTSYRPFEDHSDDSDASSLCSERSFDSYRRTSDSFSWSGSQQRLYRDVWDSGAKDIAEIIANCESTHWSDRKEGLVALQAYLQAGNMLNASELKRVTDIFTRMFMDSHTKVFSLFLDTLNELILVHRNDLNSWLYILLTRLLNKLGADLLGSIQNKILRSLDVVRESFPAELQLSAVLRFLTDPTQTPNLRVKTAALNFITKLAAITDPAQAFGPASPGRDPVQAALHKMIGWTMGDSIKQGTELRRAAQEAILALFNLNTPQVTLKLALLPKEYQEAASTLLRGRVRRGSSSSGGGTNTNSPPSPSPREYPRLASPAPQRGRPQESYSLNPEDVYRSLRKTTAEIQNYTYETGTEKPPDKDNTTSKDSGISQLSGTEALEEAMEELSVQSSSSSTATTATLTNRILTVRDCNGMDTTDNAQQGSMSFFEKLGAAANENEAMQVVLDSLPLPPENGNGENLTVISEADKQTSFSTLLRLIRDSSITVLQENFKPLLRILLGNIAADENNKDLQTRMLVLMALSELVKREGLVELFNQFIELLILKVLTCYKDTSKEIIRNAEYCANTIATTLSPGNIIRVLAPLILTGEYPLNLAAIKMLTKLVETLGRDPVCNYLPDLMPGLIRAYDNHESSVRKSAVFCMVSLHAAIGEDELRTHLAALNGSKLKLLHLYIRRAQQSPSPTSPRNHPPPSSSS